MKIKAKIGHKLHYIVNYLWHKTEWKIFLILNKHFANWWINEYLEKYKK
jgi:hypothetical protein